MNHTVKALLVAGSVFVFSSAFAEVKVGVVDLHQVLQQSSKARAINQKLEQDFKPRQQNIVGLQQQLRVDADKLNKNANVLSASQKSELENKIVKEKRDIQNAGQAYQQDLSMAQNKAMQTFFVEVKKAVDQVANQGQYDLILQKENVPFSAQKIDVTQQVIKVLG